MSNELLLQLNIEDRPFILKNLVSRKVSYHFHKLLEILLLLIKFLLFKLSFSLVINLISKFFLSSFVVQLIFLIFFLPSHQTIHRYLKCSRFLLTCCHLHILSQSSLQHFYECYNSSVAFLTWLRILTKLFAIVFFLFFLKHLLNKHC